MELSQLYRIANFIRAIADDLIRDLYVRGKYRDAILPLTVLREKHHEEAGERRIPRNAMQLIARLTLPVADQMEPRTYPLYDGASSCGPTNVQRVILP